MSIAKRKASRDLLHGRFTFVRNSEFVHLHLHSEYSLLDGACRISEIPEAAKRAGHKAVAVTDHGVLYGIIDFYKACKKAGIKPIIGCEVYVAPRTMADKEHDRDLSGNHLVFLVKNETGYKNLIYMVSKSFTEGFYSKPRIDFDLLSDHSEGLIALSACLAGYIPRMIVSGDYESAKEHAIKLNGIMGDGNFYLELQDHGLADQTAVIQGILRLHDETGIPMVATNDVHYLEKDDSVAHAALKCIQNGTHLTEDNASAFGSDEFYYKSTFEMFKRFKDHPEAIKNTSRIAEKCDFDLDFSQQFLPHYRPENGDPPQKFLRSLVEQGFDRLIKKGEIVFSDIHPEKEYRDRIEHELYLIGSMGYTEYYLIVWDFVNHSRSSGIMVGPGRGSGAGSLCAYLIGIVEIDPIVYGLLFERFLNPERVSMPDFDIDFPDGERELAIDYVRQKYGEDKVAQIITFGTMAPKAVIKDVGRVLDMPYQDVERVSSLIPQVKDITLSKALAIPEFSKLYNEDRNVRRLVDIALRLEGMPRHSSVHAAGIVITDTALYQNIPLAVNNGVVVTQFAMKNIEELGFLKFDFLAIRYLTVVENCVKLIQVNDPGFDLSAVDLNDVNTYSMISRGDTNGVFQLEKGGMKRFLAQLKPRNINDIIAAISLYRPGPMDSIPKFLENRADPSKINYPTPLLEPILSETFGCIVFQEQVMQIFRSLAGYSLGKADIVRRAISKKKTAVLEAERSGFIDGAVNNGVDEKTAFGLYEEIVKFAEYAYNKSHAAAYAMLTFRTAFLKSNYPLEYLCALLSSVSYDTAKTNEYIADCKARGVVVVSPHVNRSEVSFGVNNGKIVFGLESIRNLGADAAGKIVSERKSGGEFTSTANFFDRMKGKLTNRKQIEFLVKSGALDGLGANRRQLCSVIDLLASSFISSPFDSVEGQFDMFSSSEVSESLAMPEMPDVEEYPAKRLLSMEKEASGAFLSGGVMTDYSENIKSIADRSVISDIISPDEDSDATPARNDKMIVICALVTECVDKETKNGALMSFLKVEDESGEIDVLVFPQQRARYYSLLKTDNALKLSGRISRSEGEKPKLILESALLLKENGMFESVSDNAEYSKTASRERGNDPSADPSRLRKKLFVRFDLSDEGLRKRVFNLISIFNDGDDYALFYDSKKNEYDKDTVIKCWISDFLKAQLVELVGEDNVVVSK